MTAGEGVPVKHPDAAARVYDEEAFVVLPHKGQYKILNGVGTRVWGLIDGSRSVSDIAHIIAEEYETTYETALSDVETFLGDLENNGMLAGSLTNGGAHRNV
jgi:hypothetical protein